MYYEDLRSYNVQVIEQYRGLQNDILELEMQVALKQREANDYKAKFESKTHEFDALTDTNTRNLALVNQYSLMIRQFEVEVTNYKKKIKEQTV